MLSILWILVLLCILSIHLACFYFALPLVQKDLTTLNFKNLLFTLQGWRSWWEAAFLFAHSEPFEFRKQGSEAADKAQTLVLLETQPRLQSKWEWPGFKCRWVLSLGLRPTGAASHSAQTHGGRFPLCSDPSSAAFMSLWSDFIDFLGFPGASAVINLPAVQETWVPSLSQEDAVLGNPWTEEPGALQSMGSQSQTQLSDETTTALLSKQSIYYCSKLWKILITRKEDI